MKKIFVLLLSFALLFLTACNTNPPVDSTESGNSDGENLRDTIIGGDTKEFINLSSRIVFTMKTESNELYIVCYSKADKKIYFACYDPLCNHNSRSCFADIPNAMDSFYFSEVHFISNRFYVLSPLDAKIYSFNFDGTDMRKEYDAGYSQDMINANKGTIWSLNSLAYKNYIYIDQPVGDDGKPHTLRFDIEKGEMEDLTEQTGNYISHRFIYNGEIYGCGETKIAGNEVIIRGAYLKSDFDGRNLTQLDDLEYSSYFSGSLFFEKAVGNDDEYIGIQIFDMKTNEIKIIPKNMLGMAEDAIPSIAYVDENYVYYYNSQRFIIGYKPHPITGLMTVPVYSREGKLYRMNHDGTNPVCIFDDSTYSLNGYDCTISDNIIILEAERSGVQDGVAATWDRGYYVGTIGEDGKIAELKLIEFVG
jgi:hypothetical protein